MISMILHELATNAAKYGALSNDTGEVFIDWNLANEGRVQLNWREAGGPTVTAPERRGFGTSLIQRGLTAQLGGSAEIEYAADGIRCRLECPVR
jgi:two-component sensor histidine kinase